MTDIVWDGITHAETLKAEGAALRHRFADAARAYDWASVLGLLNDEPRLINTTRPSWYVDLHHASGRGSVVRQTSHELLEGCIGAASPWFSP